MKRIIFIALFFFQLKNAFAQDTLDRLSSEVIRSVDGRESWTVYRDTQYPKVFYTLPELARIKKEKKGSGLTVVTNDNGSISGSFQWTPVDVLEDSLSLERSLTLKYGAGLSLVPATPSTIDVNWIDLDGFGAEIALGAKPSVVAGNLEPVEFIIPTDQVEAFNEKIVSEKCRLTSNCGLLILIDYRFILPSADGRVGSFTHAFASFIDAAPYCKVYTIESKCLASSRH